MLNSNNKPIAIVLGGTFPHRELINKLKKRDYYVVLIDYLSNPSGKELADIHIKESTLDKDKVLKIAQDYDAKLVISTCVDQANVTACYVAEKLQLPSPYPYEVSLAVTDKKTMKEKMVGNNIPTARHIVVDSIISCDKVELNYPLIVKPVDSNSSKGVRRANDKHELVRFLKEALKLSRDGRAIIEEFIVGKEIGADCIIQNNKASIIMTRERRKMIIDAKNPIQQIQGSFWPATLGANQINKLKDIVEKIAKVFELDNTPLMIQAIVNGDDISVIEFAARIGGGENYKIIELHADYDIIEAGICSFLNIPMQLNQKLPEGHFADIYLYVKPSTFGRIDGFNSILEDKTIECFHKYKVTGTEIGSDLSSNARVGSFLVKSGNKDDLIAKINKAIESIEVYDIKGEPIMRKDIYTNN